MSRKPSKLAKPELGDALDKVPARLAKYRTMHDPVRDENCAVCQHPDMTAIEVAFMRWTPLADLATAAGIEEETLKAHFEATGKTLQRSNNTDSLIAALMEMKFGNIKAADISTKDLIALIKHRDKLNKRVESTPKGDRPTVVVIQGIPGRAQLMEDENQQVLEGKQVPILGPGGKPHD